MKDRSLVFVFGVKMNPSPNPASTGRIQGDVPPAPVVAECVLEDMSP